MTIHYENSGRNQKMIFLKFYFLNTDFSITMLSLHLKLKEVLYNIPLEGRVSQIFNLGPGYIVLT